MASEAAARDAAHIAPAEPRMVIPRQEKDWSLLRRYAGPLVVLAISLGLFVAAKSVFAEARWHYREVGRTEQKLKTSVLNANLTQRQRTRHVNRLIVQSAVKGGYLDRQSGRLFFKLNELDKSVDLQTACPFWHELVVLAYTIDNVSVRQSILPLCPADPIVGKPEYHDLHGITWRGLTDEDYQKLSHLLVFSSLDARVGYKVSFGQDLSGKRYLQKVEEIRNPHWYR